MGTEYKFDSRTEVEFIKDMEKGLANEVIAIRKFAEILNNSNVENPSIIYVGSEEEGKVLMDGDKVGNVDIFPDYMVKWKDSVHRIRYSLIEVKICNPNSDFTFFKKKQLEQYVEIDSVMILFVMGFSTTDPEFILVKPDDIISIGGEPELIFGKETFKINKNLFIWDKFQSFQRNYNVLGKNYIGG
jgi:hypothetical protein